MDKIVRKNGYVYLVEGNNIGFETYYNLGKDIDSPIWKEESEEITKSQKKKRKKSN